MAAFLLLSLLQCLLCVLRAVLDHREPNHHKPRGVHWCCSTHDLLLDEVQFWLNVHRCINSVRGHSGHVGTDEPLKYFTERRVVGQSGHGETSLLFQLFVVYCLYYYYRPLG